MTSDAVFLPDDEEAWNSSRSVLLMIRVECPKCEQVLRIDEELAGSASTCPECSGRFRVPRLVAAR